MSVVEKIKQEIIQPKKNGLLVIEIGSNQYLIVSSLLRQQGFREISRQCDYNHNVRCIISTKV